MAGFTEALQATANVPVSDRYARMKFKRTRCREYQANNSPQDEASNDQGHV
jgi:hypothetical protein